MLCKKCGTNISEDIKFCPNCGAQNDMIASNVQGEVNNQQPMMEQSVNDVAPVQQPMNYTTPVQQPINDVSSVQQSMYNQPMNNQSMNYNQQPMYNQQPTLGENNNYSYNNMGGSFNNENNNKASTGLIVGVFIAVIAAAGVIYFSFFGDGKNKNSNSNSNVASNSNITSTVNSNVVSQITSNKPSNTTSQVTSNITSQIASNKTSQLTSNKVSNTTTSKYTKVTCAGYTFEVPSQYKLNQTTAQMAHFINYNDKSQVIIIPTNQSYAEFSKMKNSKSNINEYLKGTGLQVNANFVRKTFGGKEFFVSDFTYNGASFVMAFSKMPDGNTMVLEFVNSSFTKDYSKISLFAHTVQSAKAK